MLLGALAASVIAAGPVAPGDGLRVIDESRARVLDLRLDFAGAVPVHPTRDSRRAARGGCTVLRWMALVGAMALGRGLGGHYVETQPLPLDFLFWHDPTIAE